VVTRRWAIWVLLPFLLQCGDGIETLKNRTCMPNGDFATLDDFVYSAGKGSFANRIRRGTNDKFIAVGKGVFSNDVEHWIVRQGTTAGTLWETIDDFTYPSGTNSGASDFVLDLEGNLVVVGYGTSGGVERWVTRRSEDAGLTWEIVDDYVLQVGGNSRALAVTRDRDGVLFATGYATATSRHWITRKSTDNGVTWTVADDFQFETAQNSQGNGITTDPSGNIFAVGSGVVSGETRWITRKLINGATTWTVVDSYLADNSTTASAADVVSDQNGILFATGLSDDSTDQRGVTRKSVNNGVTWTTIDSYKTGDDTDTAFTGVAVDAIGNPYVTGFGNSLGGVGDIWLVRKSTDAGSTWSDLSQFQVAGGNSSRGASLLFDPTGSLFAAGFGEDPSADRWVLRRSSCSL